jgi:hypothetical protein
MGGRSIRLVVACAGRARCEPRRGDATAIRGGLREGERVTRRVHAHAAGQRSWIGYGCWVGAGVGVRLGYGWMGRFPLRDFLRDTSWTRGEAGCGRLCSWLLSERRVRGISFVYGRAVGLFVEACLRWSLCPAATCDGRSVQRRALFSRESERGNRVKTSVGSVWLHKCSTLRSSPSPFAKLEHVSRRSPRAAR